VTILSSWRPRKESEQTQAEMDFDPLGSGRSERTGRIDILYDDSLGDG
jgi:hypothetical protein